MLFVIVERSSFRLTFIYFLITLLTFHAWSNFDSLVVVVMLEQAYFKVFVCVCDAEPKLAVYRDGWIHSFDSEGVEAYVSSMRVNWLKSLTVLITKVKMI